MITASDDGLQQGDAASLTQPGCDDSAESLGGQPNNQLLHNDIDDESDELPDKRKRYDETEPVISGGCYGGGSGSNPAPPQQKDEVVYIIESDNDSCWDNHMECILCADRHDLDEVEMVALPCCGKMVCSEMLEGHVRSKMDSMELPPICPMMSLKLCDNKLNEAVCRNVLSNEASRQSFSDLMQRTNFDEIGLVFCQHPDCKGAVLPSDLGQPNTLSTASTHFVCPLNPLTHQFCTECNVPWHKDETCEVYRKRIQEQEVQRNGEAAMIASAISSKGWKKCFNCKNGVEKVDGCRHMTCRCGAEFCYNCGGVWKNCKKKFSGAAAGQPECRC